MSWFVWNEAFSVGVVTMDSQHKRLVELVNQFYDAMRQSKGDQILLSVLQELVNYTVVHFAAEEKLMQKVGFPKLTEHQQIHKGLTEQAKKLLEQVKAGKMVATVSVANFLKEWLVKHIQGADREYGMYVQQQQLVNV